MRLHVCLLYITLALALPLSLDADTLDDVIEKHIEAMGGLGNISAVKSVRTVADAAMAGMQGTVTISYQYPDKYRNDIVLPIGRMVQVADGDDYWMIDLNGQVRAMSGEESQEMITSLFMETGAYLDPQYRGDAVRYLGESEVDSAFYHLVHVHPEGGRQTTLYIDAETYLVGFSEFTVQMFNVRAWQEDYRQVGGVMVPCRTRQETGFAAMDTDLTVSSHEINVDLPDSLFVRPGAAEVDFHISGEGATAVDMNLRSFHVYIPVMVNGEGPYRFVLDSGAGLTVISTEIVDRLGLERSGQLPAVGTGGTEVGSFVVLDSVSVGDAVMIDLVAGELDLSTLNQFVQEEIEGILGYELFSRFVVQIDYGDSLLTLFMPDYAELPAGEDTVALEFEQNHPMISGVINDSIRGRFRIDTGSMNYLDLHSHVVREYDLISKSKSALSGIEIRGLGNNRLSSTLGRLESFRIGAFAVNDLPCGFSTSDSGLFAVEGIDGNIGGGLLSKFTCTFDYPRGWLCLTPNQRFYEADDIVSAGIVARKQGDTVVVSQVLAGSSAEENGIRIGDRIVSINGVSVYGLELYKVTELLNSKESDVVELEFEREGVIRKAVLEKKALF